MDRWAGGWVDGMVGRWRGGWAKRGWVKGDGRAGRLMDG